MTRDPQPSSPAAAGPRRGPSARLFIAAATLLVTSGCATDRISAGLADANDALRATMAFQGDIGIEAPSSQLRQLDLPSGLRVGFERTPTRGMVGVVLVVGGGSSRDPAGKEGLAHLVEHLTFHAHFERKPVSEALARLAATYNADTTLDRTRFFEFAPRAGLPALLRLAAQRLTNPLAGVSEDEFSVEREIIKNEMRQRNETMVYGQVAQWTQRALFPADHPYTRPVGGNLNGVGLLTLADARALAASTYVPRNATLLIVGDFDLDAAVAGIDRDFPAALRASGPPRPQELASRQAPPAYLPPAPAAGFGVLKAGVAWPEIWLTYFLADMYGPYAPAMKALTASVVVKTLRDILIKDDDVADVELETSELRQATILACRITLLSERRRAEIAERARLLIASLWSLRPDGQRSGSFVAAESGLDMALLAKTQRLALADAIFESEAFTGRAIRRAQYFHMTGAVNAYDALINAVAALPFQSIVAHGAYLLAPERARVLFVEPLPEDQRPAPGAVGVPTITNRSMKETPLQGMDFGPPPPSAVVPELQRARRFRLANGLRVVLVQRPQFPAITAALGFTGGAAASPQGVVELLRLLEREGTFALDQNALEIRKADGKDYAADVVVAGRRNLSNALFMLSTRLRVLDRVPWRTILAGVDRSIDRAPAKESPARRSGRAFWHALYGDHPYARVLGVNDLRQVEAGAIKTWLPRLYNPANATLVIVGDFDMASTEDLVSRWFGNWTGAPGAGAVDVPPVPAPVPAPTVAVAGSAGETVLVTHRPGSTQVDMTLGCRLPGGNDPRSLAIARMLAGVVAGDLNVRLREEAGAAYTVSGDAAVLRGGGAHLLVHAAIDNRRFHEALRVIRGHWEAFGRDGFDRGALSQVRWQWARVADLSFQTSTDTALSVLEAANQDWSPAQLVDLPATYLNVSGADLQRAFAVCRRSTVLSLLGDKPSIDAAVAPPGTRR